MSSSGDHSVKPLGVYFAKSAIAALRGAKTVVFWDMVECPIPEGMDVVSVSKNIRLGLKKAGYQGETVISAFGNRFEHPPGYMHEFVKADVMIHHLPEGDNEARRQMFLTHMLCEAVDYRPPVTLMLIMEDIMSTPDVQFRNAFEYLKRKHYNCIVAQPIDLPRRSYYHVSTAWGWDALSAGGEPVKALPFDPSDAITPPPRATFDWVGYNNFSTAETFIFWDIQACPVPDNDDAGNVVGSIARALYNMRYSNVTTCNIAAYCNVFEMMDVMCETNIAMIHGATEVDRRKKILVDFMYEAADHRRAINLMLIMNDISGHPEFLHAFAFLKRRGNFNILLAHPQVEDVPLVSQTLLGSVRSIWLWSNLSVAGGPMEEEESADEEEEEDKEEPIGGKELSSEYSSTDSEASDYESDRR